MRGKRAKELKQIARENYPLHQVDQGYKLLKAHYKILNATQRGNFVLHHLLLIYEKKSGIVTEHPILFSTEMVQAKLDGRKTQTRRMNGLQKVNVEPGNWEYSRFYNGFAKFTEHCNALNELYLKCPYGSPCDILWVREPFRVPNPYGKPHYEYKASWDTYNTGIVFKWKPSIHMPKDAARIYLQIENVRAERLQEITEFDVVAEGFTVPNQKIYAHDMLFAAKWCEMHGPSSYSDNPWVWVISFRNDIRNYLSGNLKLTVKDNYQVFPVAARGVDFVGYVFYHSHTTSAQNNKAKFRKDDIPQ